ncbi:L-type lectin-domain containing receptor kinase IX.1 [Glycine soja]|uniref:non-specific serine/threonine protein kinase n=1 Tax=Glycine soja TaxID=3848 RepID=A0A445JAT4_GLYSO|nr:L-type lectin-domain containing receptor kinase IX.1 [Glycine soja]
MAWWRNSLQNPTLLFCYATRTIFILQIIPLANSLSFDYPNFKNGDVKWEGDASILKGAIQVTSNTMDQNNNYSVGRVTSYKKMLLWDMNTGKLADFTTKFSFVVFSGKSYYGDGMAFFLADPNLPLLKNIREGGGLGLVDGKQVLNSTQPFVAVEFDTFHNKWDPQGGTHVGLNFNSMRSNITKQWLTDIQIWNVYNCSIEYNSSTLNLSVSFTTYNNVSKPVEEYISYKVDLRDYLPGKVILGFSAATGKLYEVHTLRSWSFNSSLQSDENTNEIKPVAAPPTSNPASENEHKIGLWVGIGIGVGLVLGLLGLICALLWKRSRDKKGELVFDLNMADEFPKGTGPKSFCYNELVSATNKFAEKLGQGGFGGVYKGYLKDLKSYVAIKRISKESRQGMKEYVTEVKVISQLRHRNLVQLIGWCHRKNDFLLIYEFMPNGSLDSHLYGVKSFLTWTVRYNIALGLASALLYLQEEWEQCVIHRDIKSSNIMLDSCFNAKLGDFGLARLVDHEKGSQTTRIAGTRGYIAPEYFTSGKATKESDIYSFGVVLLEIASGRKPVELEAEEGQITVVEWVWKLYGLGRFLEAADPKLCGEFDENQMERLVIVGLWCVHPDYSFRPSIRQVIQVLKFESALPILPEMMPVPTYLPPTIKALFSSVSSSFWGRSGGDATQIIQHLSYHVNITDQLSKSVTVGISAATGEYTEEHTLFSWSFSTSTSSPTPSKGHSKKGRINTILLEGTGIGTGYFKGLNSYAAMKRISAGSAQSLKEYAEEVTIISQLRHMNLVKLAGWCHKKNDLFLIYEYMPNGSLDSCLFGGEKFLPWKVRYNVALGLASAWLYLQEECEKFVFHREIKSSNIMVDSNFSAKLGDFGLARQVDHEKGSQSSVGVGP